MIVRLCSLILSSWSNGSMTHLPSFKVTSWSNGTHCISYYILKDRCHDDVIKWKVFPRYWPFVRKGQWRRALMFSLICAWINDWVNTGQAGDLRRYRAHYDVTVVVLSISCDIAFKCWMRQDLTCEPTLVLIMALGHKATSHLIGKYWPTVESLIWDALM